MPTKLTQNWCIKTKSYLFLPASGEKHSCNENQKTVYTLMGKHEEPRFKGYLVRVKSNWMMYFTIHPQNSRLRSRTQLSWFSWHRPHLSIIFKCFFWLVFSAPLHLYMLSILIVLILLKWDHMPLFPNCNGYKWFHLFHNSIVFTQIWAE